MIGEWDKSNFFFAKNSNFTNYFNDSISIVKFLFTPMILFIKEYSIQKIFINSEINTFSFIFIIWIFEEIIYLILRYILFLLKTYFLEELRYKIFLFLFYLYTMKLGIIFF